jgi:cytochrome bd-type quinol oxidase subunit 2
MGDPAQPRSDTERRGVAALFALYCSATTLGMAWWLSTSHLTSRLAAWTVAFLLLALPVVGVGAFLADLPRRDWRHVKAFGVVLLLLALTGAGVRACAHLDVVPVPGTMDPAVSLRPGVG